MIRHAAWLALALTACAPSLEQNLGDAKQWQAPAAGAYPDDTAVVLEQSEKLLIAGGAGKTVTQAQEHRVIAVLREGAYDVADYQLVLPDYTELADFRGRTINPGGEVLDVGRDDVLEADATNIYKVDDDDAAKGNKFLSERNGKVYTVTFPGVRVGSIVEYVATFEYTGGIPTTETFGPSGPWPIRHYEAEVQGTSHFRHVMQLFNTRAQLVHEDTVGGWKVRWEERDLPAPPHEGWLPHWSQWRPWAAFRIKQEIHGNYVQNVAREWKDVLGGVANDLYLENDKVLAGFDEKLDKTGCTDKTCLVERALAFVRDHTDVDGIGGIGSMDPLTKVLRNRDASSAEMAMLAWKLLTDAGVDAKFVLVATNREWMPGLDTPLGGVYNHLVLQVPAQDGLAESFFVDPSCEFCAIGELPSWSRDVPGQILTAEERFERDPEVTATPVVVHGKATASTRYEVDLDLALDAAGALQGTMRGQTSGDGAIWERAYNKDRPERFHRDHARDIVTERWPGSTATRVQATTCDEAKAHCEWSIDLKAPGYGTDAGGRLLVPLTALSRMNWFQREERKFDLDIGADGRATHVDSVTFTLPEGWKLDHAPRGERVVSPAFDYQLAVRADGRKITVTRTVEVRPGRWPAAQFAQLREPLVAADAARQKSLVLVRDAVAPPPPPAASPQPVTSL